MVCGHWGDILGCEEQRMLLKLPGQWGPLIMAWREVSSVELAIR